MIKQYKKGQVSSFHTLTQALEIDLHNSAKIAVVGGGGKTTTIETLAKEYVSFHHRVIVTPTTKINIPSYGSFIWSMKEDVIEKIGGIITVGQPVGGLKLSAVPPDFYNKLAGLSPVILMEADGSKGLPIKAPSDWEPVIPMDATIVIGVVGIDCLNKSIKDICHRPKQVAALLNKSLEDNINEEDVAIILSSVKGTMKSVKPYMDYRIIINKVDDESQFKSACCIGGLLEKKGLESCVFTSKYRGYGE